MARSSPTRTARTRGHAVRPRLDPLEGRLLLTAGDLDPTFGTGGFVLAGFPSKGQSNASGLANAVAVQGDGSILAAGNGPANNSYDFGLMRFRPDGHLDPAFGSGGKVTTDFKGYFDDVRDLATQPDGKIVAVGSSDQGSKTRGHYNYDFALARYNTNGTLDTTFGPSRTGKVTTGISTWTSSDYASSLDDQAMAAAIQPDGKLIAAGWSFVSDTETAFALARYNTNGTLDTTFGPNRTGKVTTDLSPGSPNLIYDIVVLASGKILVAGASQHQFALARYNPDGSLDDGSPTDTTPGDHFGTNGSVITTIAPSGNSFAKGVAVQPDGKIVVAGSSFNGSDRDFALARYDTDGNPDTMFGTGGIAILSRPGHQTASSGVGLQADGKIVIAGYLSTGNLGTTDNVILARVDGTGHLDASFGTGGFSTSTFGGTDERANAMALQPDGRIVTAGQVTLAGGLNDFAVARYLNDSPAATSASAAMSGPAPVLGSAALAASSTTLFPLAPVAEAFDLAVTWLGTESGRRRSRSLAWSS